MESSSEARVRNLMLIRLQIVYEWAAAGGLITYDAYKTGLFSLLMGWTYSINVK